MNADRSDVARIAGAENPEKTDEPVVRHLARGGELTTLCGLPRGGVPVAHPSKARKTDCAGCREALRAATAKKPAPEPAPAPPEPAPEPIPELEPAPRSKWKPTKAEVTEVRRLRAQKNSRGRPTSYIDIERAMGWPDGHGNRPFRIMHGAWDYESLAD